MSTVMWTSPHAGVIGFYGYGAAHTFDRHIPIASVDEWGIDVLRRTVCVAAPLVDDFVAGLNRGAVYNGFYLQSWQPSSDALAPEFSLIYKGFLHGIPDPLISNDRTELVSSVSTTSALSVPFHGKTIVAATKESKYDAPSTTYRYIKEGEPTLPTYSAVHGAEIQPIGSPVYMLTFDDGTTQSVAGNAPAAVATALFSTPINFVIGPNAQHIFGTPYWEATDVVRRQYPGS